MDQGWDKKCVLNTILPFPQYFADVTEARSWLDDRKPLLIDEDYGKDEASSTALLQRHQRLEKEMEAYASEVKRLGEQAKSASQLAPLTVSHNQNSLLIYYTFKALTLSE